MMTNAFISYSHLDARVLERLQTHLAMLRREGNISTWSDREIRAGSKLDDEIAKAHGGSLLFLPIVSPDFLASGYCYDKEMKTALEKAEAGKMVIVPIIAQPCDWLASPLAKFKAVPKDGKPISEWANENNAYLDIVTELRRVLNAMTPPSPTPEHRSISLSKPQLRIARHFTSIDRDKYRDDAFNQIQKYFRDSVLEIGNIGEIQSRFEDMNSNSFTCSIVNRARSNQESHLTLLNKKGGRFALGDLVCSFTPFSDGSSANEIISVGADDYSLFLTMNMRASSAGGSKEEKLSPAQVADILWRDFIKRAGIEYE